MSSLSRSETLPSRLLIVAGTYDGVLAGWEIAQEHEDDSSSLLKLTFATPVHEGSTRHVCMAASVDDHQPGTLLTCGYDEMLKTHDWSKRMTSSGEIRTPADFGTPTCVSFCPPPSEASTSPSSHCLVGFDHGKLVLYKKRDWSIQHVFAGHEGGISSLTVHPSGKMALTGGARDGKIKLWDLTKGRLAYSDVVVAAKKNKQRDMIESLQWSNDGDAYAWCHGNHVRVRSVNSSGNDLVNVDLPSRVNQVALLNGPRGLFVAAACNDGSLPVLLCSPEEDEIRAVMAIEPVENVIAGEERFKCIRSVREYLVVTANSAGVISVMDLNGAINMILQDDKDDDKYTNPIVSDGEEDDASDNGEEELAVDIIESTRLGTGARITSLAVWSLNIESTEDEEEEVMEQEGKGGHAEEVEENIEAKRGSKRKVVEMDDQALKKARELVHQAKKVKKKKDRKKAKREKTKKEL